MSFENRGFVKEEKELKKICNKREEAVAPTHVYCCGAKSIGLYGGYESFILNLLHQHQYNKNIKYYVACKANGEGCMDLSQLPGAVAINSSEFIYCNAHCFMIKVPEKIGAAQAIYYDIMALRWCCEHIKKNHIENPIVYILASRIGPFEKRYVKMIHAAGGKVYQNPDGHEDWRAKWGPLIRKYWKVSERFAVKNADLVVCDSKSIEEYIQKEYHKYNPRTTFIAYGSNVKPSILRDDAPQYVDWLSKNELKDRNFYTIVGRFVPENNFETIIREFMLSDSQKESKNELKDRNFYTIVGRFVPENNFETIIREFMLSDSQKDLAIITTKNTKLMEEIEE